MLKRILLSFLLTFFYLLISFEGNGQEMASGSLEIVQKGGEWFVEHRIAKNETLYSLSKRYGTSVEEIRESNPGLLNVININDLVLIPITDNLKSIHTVESGETLYSIARSYNVKVSSLRKWNSIRGNEISVGQQLQIFNVEAKVPKTTRGTSEKVHHVEIGESLYGIAHKYNVSVDELKKWNDLESNEIDIGQELIIKGSTPNTGYQEVEDAGESRFSDQDSVSDSMDVLPPHLGDPFLPFDKREERGMAELIDGSTETVKYLALHRNAPNGTIIKVRNELNDKVVFVRVIGPLPDTGINNKVTIKISRVAWESLGAVNKRLRVKTSYIK